MIVSITGCTNIADTMCVRIIRLLNQIVEIDMILSRSALSIVELTKPDKDLPALDAVCIYPDGSIAASNGKVVGIVSPCKPEILRNVPLDDSGPLRRNVLLSSNGVYSILKAMIRDTMFKGLLEHCDISVEDDVKITVTDGKRMNTITLNPLMRTGLDYKTEFRGLNSVSVSDVVVNRKRLRNALETMDKVCAYDGSFSPVYISFVSGDRILLKTVHELNGQRLLMLFQNKIGALDQDEFEMKLGRKAERIKT